MTEGTGNLEPVVLTEDLDAASAETVAREVLAGRWGRGRTRAARLKAAGHDVNAVQAAYNKILGRA